MIVGFYVCSWRHTMIMIMILKMSNVWITKSIHSVWSQCVGFWFTNRICVWWAATDDKSSYGDLVWWVIWDYYRLTCLFVLVGVSNYVFKLHNLMKIKHVIAKSAVLCCAILDISTLCVFFRVAIYLLYFRGEYIR